MKHIEVEKPYEFDFKGETYCFHYPNPVTRNGGRTYSEVARYWKKGTDSEITYPFFVKGEDIGQLHRIIIEGIKEELSK